MSNNKLIFDGMDELKRQLRNLPKELTGEASKIVMDSANDAANAARADYPEVTGNLRKGVKVSSEAVGQFGAGAVVKSTSPHAWLYDHGSQARHWDTGKSTGKMWGKTRPKHTFAKAMIRHRKRMYARLKELLVSKGLLVTGDER